MKEKMIVLCLSLLLVSCQGKNTSTKEKADIGQESTRSEELEALREERIVLRQERKKALADYMALATVQESLMENLTDEEEAMIVFSELPVFDKNRPNFKANELEPVALFEELGRNWQGPELSMFYLQHSGDQPGDFKIVNVDSDEFVNALYFVTDSGKEAKDLSPLKNQALSLKE